MDLTVRGSVQVRIFRKFQIPKCRECVASGPCSALHPSLTAAQKLIASLQQPTQTGKELIARI